MEINGTFLPVSAVRARDLIGFTAELSKKIDKTGGAFSGSILAPLTEQQSPNGGDIAKRLEGGSYKCAASTIAKGWPGDTNF